MSVMNTKNLFLLLNISFEKLEVSGRMINMIADIKDAANVYGGDCGHTPDSFEAVNNFLNSP